MQPVTPRELILRLAQEWVPGRPVTCRGCCRVWPDHARGCPVHEGLQALWKLEHAKET